MHQRNTNTNRLECRTHLVSIRSKKGCTSVLEWTTFICNRTRTTNGATSTFAVQHYKILDSVIHAKVCVCELLNQHSIMSCNMCVKHLLESMSKDIKQRTNFLCNKEQIITNITQSCKQCFISL